MRAVWRPLWRGLGSLSHPSGDTLQPGPKAPELIPADSGHILHLHSASAVNVEVYQRGTLLFIQVHQTMVESGVGFFPVPCLLLSSVQQDVARRNCQNARLPLMMGCY